MSRYAADQSVMCITRRQFPAGQSLTRSSRCAIGYFRALPCCPSGVWWPARLPPASA